jgi:hypothetical protein
MACPNVGLDDQGHYAVVTSEDDWIKYETIFMDDGNYWEGVEPTREEIIGYQKYVQENGLYQIPVLT